MKAGGWDSGPLSHGTPYSPLPPATLDPDTTHICFDLAHDPPFRLEELASEVLEAQEGDVWWWG